MEWIKKNPKKIVSILFALMLMVGIVTCRDYGQPLDEQFETGIMLANIKEYAAHIPIAAIRDKIVNSNKLSSIELIHESEERDHGEAAYYPYVVISAVTSGMFHIESMWIMHIYTFILFFVGVASLYCIVLRIFGSRRIAFFAALCLYLTPRMFAEGHYNNKDMVLLVMALFTILWGIRFIENQSYTDAVVFAAGGAVAMNTKIAGAWFFGAIGIAYLVKLIIRREMNMHTFKVGLTALIMFAAAYALLTPAMWNNPVEFIRYLITSANDFTRWDNYILFAGELYKGSVNPLPAWYLPYMICITTPVWIIAAMAAGLAALIINFFRHREEKSWKMTAGITVLWLFPLIYAVATHTRLYNGWRHFYFIYGPMIITAVYGMVCIWNIIRTRSRTAGYIIAMVIVIYSLVGMIWNHPYQNCYYNRLAGDDVENRYELDYWDVSIMQILRDLKRDNQDGVIRVGSSDRWTLVGLKKNLRVLDDDALVQTDWREAEYVLLNTTYSVIDSTDDTRYVIENYDKIRSVKSYGNTIMEIYRKPE